MARGEEHRTNGGWAGPDGTLELTVIVSDRLQSTSAGRALVSGGVAVWRGGPSGPHLADLGPPSSSTGCRGGDKVRGRELAGRPPKP